MRSESLGGRVAEAHAARLDLADLDPAHQPSCYAPPMLCLARISSLSIACLLLAGCSDDGLAPPIDTDAMTTSGPVSGNESTADNDANDAADSTPQGTGTGSTGSTGDPTGGGPGDTTVATDDGESSTTDEPLPPPMVCEDADQCVLVDNCCECAAHHVDDVVPDCEMECDQPMCAALGIPEIGVVCDDGTCGRETHDCSGLVACNALPPDCPDGTLPEVSEGGGCWSGACIPVAACDPVPGCDYCDETEACVTSVTQLGTFYSCRAVPDDCGGVPTCDCMPPDTCEAPFDTCESGDGQITCSCPAC